ncbi:uncharacterized protein LOC141536771 [Cotesia typhae]|uniref:uncharacterized protein LOC141536771 n=1 Tax=Cotesia typhae TaxID=2053667 RepID=UPI003D698898
MTARLNQDKLEQFFGIVRSACGCNEHPDPILFGQVFRLLCSYSLVTPLKGSNVTAVELLQSLMETKESLLITKDKKLKWLEKIDTIIEDGFCEEDSNINLNVSVAERPFENLVDESSEEEPDHPELNGDITNSSSSGDHLREDFNNTNVSVAEQPFETLLDESSEEELDHRDPHLHHDYDVPHTSTYVIAYIAGYVTRKMQRFSRCFDCLSSLESDEFSDRNTVIDAMGDSCKRPSENLYKLIERLENIVLQVVGTKTVKMNTMSQILDKIAEEKLLPYVGCEEHRLSLMKKLLNYFITIRGHFLANSINRNYTNRKSKSKKLRKISKLI